MKKFTNTFEFHVDSEIIDRAMARAQADMIERTRGLHVDLIAEEEIFFESMRGWVLAVGPWNNWGGSPNKTQKIHRRFIDDTDELVGPYHSLDEQPSRPPVGLIHLRKNEYSNYVAEAIVPGNFHGAVYVDNLGFFIPWKPIIIAGLPDPEGWIDCIWINNPNCPEWGRDYNFHTKIED